MKRIIYEQDGIVKVVIPSPEFADQLELLAQTVVPVGILYKIVATESLPSCRNFRSAWQVDGATVFIDMDKAKEIQKDVVRAEREPLLSELDTQYLRALEDNNTETIASIIEEKKILRDATDSSLFKNAKTPEELKKITLDRIKEEAKSKTSASAKIK